MPCLAKRFASDVETADKAYDSFKKYAYLNLLARELRIVKDPLLTVPQKKKIDLTVLIHQHNHTDLGEYFWAPYAKTFSAHIIQNCISIQ
jgi:hypothetical protein